MKRTTIRELKHQTSKVLAMVESGGSQEICRRGKPVAILAPPVARNKPAKPDFAGRMREIYGDRVLAGTGTDRVSEMRGER